MNNVLFFFLVLIFVMQSKQSAQNLELFLAHVFEERERERLKQFPLFEVVEI